MQESTPSILAHLNVQCVILASLVEHIQCCARCVRMVRILLFEEQQICALLANLVAMHMAEGLILVYHVPLEDL